MSRLIDAESLKDRFERLMNDKSLKEEQRIYGVAVTAIKNIIDAHPTAYDVEKVVAELEQKSFSVPNSSGGYIYEKYAVDAVRKGGVENE